MNTPEVNSKSMPDQVDNNTLVGIIHRSALPRPIKSFLTALATFRNHTTYLCNPAVRTIAQRMGCNESTVWRALKVARAAGILSVSSIGGGYSLNNVSNSYTIHSEAVINYKRDRNSPPHLDTQGSQIARDGLANCNDRDRNSPPKPSKEEPKREPKKAKAATTSHSKRRSASPLLPPLPDSLSHGDLPARWAVWVEYRSQSKYPLTPMACKIQFKDFEKWGIEKSCLAIDRAISSGWRAPYEPKSFRSTEQKTTSAPTGTTDAELDAILAQAPSTNRSR